MFTMISLVVSKEEGLVVLSVSGRCELNLASREHTSTSNSLTLLSSDFSMTKVVSETRYVYVLPLSDTSLADIHVDG